MSDNKEILGTGWKFPPAFNRASGGVEMASGIEDIDESLYLIIHTKLSERIMRPEFGSTIHDLVFEPLNPNLKTYMISSLRTAITEGEPRIILEEINLEQRDMFLGRVDIKLVYRPIESNVTENLVVPFYTSESQTF